MGKILYLECNSGISGDMTVGALLDLGADRQVLENALKSLGVDGYHLHFGRKDVCGLDAFDFDVHLEVDGHGNVDGHNHSHGDGHSHENEPGDGHGHSHGEGHSHVHDYCDGNNQDHGHSHEAAHMSESIIEGVQVHEHVHEGHVHIHEDNSHAHEDHGHIHEEHGHAHEDHGHAHEDHSHIHEEHGHAHEDHGHIHEEHGHAHEDHGHAHEDHSHIHEDHSHAHEDHGHVHEDHSHVHEDNSHAHEDHGHAHEDHSHVHEDHSHVHEDHSHVHEDYSHAHEDHSHAHEDHIHTHEDHDHHHNDHDHPHIHRNLHDIYHIIDHLDSNERVKELARKMFRIVAEAESKAHGLPIEQVHFHEVGAIDSIVDIISVAVCIDNLGVEDVVVSALSEGRGHVRCQHGVLPVPVPATANIASSYGLELHFTDNDGEMVTPTGAAIAAALRTRNRLPASCRLLKIGMGAGNKVFKQANVLRAMLLETAGEEDGSMWVLETNLDDCTGEMMGLTMELLFEAGAADVWYTPICMKKNRPAYMMSLLCRESSIEKMEEIILTQTTTIGIRRYATERTVLERSKAHVDTCFGPADVKVCTFKGRKFFYPEYESVQRICRDKGLDFQTVYYEVRMKAEAAGEK